MKKIYQIFLMLMVSALFLSFGKSEKMVAPHLIVGCWNIFESQKPEHTFHRKIYFLDQICFGSDEFTAHFSFKTNKEKEITKTFAYKIYTDFPEGKYPVILFKNTTDRNFKLLFSIENIDKKTLELKFIPQYSSQNFFSKIPETIRFERTAGPPENID